MAWQFGIGAVLVILLVIFLIPTVDVLKVTVTIPPDQNNINLGD